MQLQLEGFNVHKVLVDLLGHFLKLCNCAAVKCRILVWVGEGRCFRHNRKRDSEGSLINSAPKSERARDLAYVFSPT